MRGLPEEIHDDHLHCPRAHAYAHCVPRAEGHLPGKAGATLKRDPEKIVMVCIRVVISPQPIKERNKNDVEWQHLQYCAVIEATLPWFKANRPKGNIVWCHLARWSLEQRTFGSGMDGRNNSNER